MHLHHLPRLTLLAALLLPAACGDSDGSGGNGTGTGADDGADDGGTGGDGGDDGTDDGGTSGGGDDGGTGEESGLCEDDAVDFERPDHWTRPTHCKGVDPNYDFLFDSSVVHRFDITIDPASYAAMEANLAELFGGGGGPGPGDFPDEDPIFVPVTIEFDGELWTEVGMRYKGNSSLHSAYNQGIKKLAFRLSFDKYEESHPELLDQRFYGFKKMTFSNGFVDPSLTRDKVGGDIFRAAGVPVARSAFARVYVDFGEGSTYFGLYTMIEDPSNKMIDTQFGDGSGNMYKPDGDGARLQTFVEDHMVKKTNEEAADFTDVQNFIAVLNNGSGESWRAELESVFDVDGFLTYLALNQTMVNWDSYGWMTHNYYLYADPSDNGRIKWIPWDLNESLMIRGMVPGGSGVPSDSVLLEAMGSEWPLIRRLLDDPVYEQAYRDALANGLAGAFDATTVKAMMQSYHDLIAPYVSGPDGEMAPYSLLSSQAEFDGALTEGNNGLLPFVDTRRAAVESALQ